MVMFSIFSLSCNREPNAIESSTSPPPPIRFQRDATKLRIRLNNTECGWYGRWQGTVSASNEWGRFLFLLFCLDEALRICCLFAGAGSDVVFRLDLPLQMEKQLYWQRLSLRICWISLIPILPGMAAPIAVALQPPNENEARDT
jgi:hypothetical protein